MGKIFGGCLGIMVLAFLIDLFIAWVIMELWNFVAPGLIPNAPTLEFWQAFGVLLLLSIVAGLFKSK